jgi:nucleoside-diphosphate-sugar epimerase
MQYQFDEPFVVDSTAIRRELGVAATPLDDALAATGEYYRAVERASR